MAVCANYAEGLDAFVHAALEVCGRQGQPIVLAAASGANPDAERVVSFFLFCFLPIAYLTLWAASWWLNRRVKMWFKCQNPDCATTFEGRYEGRFPIECPHCKQETAMYARKCCECGTVFGTNGWWGRAVCPNCQSWHVEKCTGE